MFPSLEHMLGRSGVDGQNKTLKKASYVDISKLTQALTKKEKFNLTFKNVTIGWSSLLIVMVALKRAGVLFSRPNELVVYPPNPYRVRPCLLRA